MQVEVRSDENQLQNRGGFVSRINELLARRKQAGDLDVDYDQTETFNTNGDEDAGSGEDEVPAPADDLPGTEETATDPGSADVEDLDDAESGADVDVGGYRSEVTVPDDQVDHDHEGTTEASKRRPATRRVPPRTRAAHPQRKKADEVETTDVENLDDNPVEVEELIQPDAVTDVETPVDQGNQLEAADRPDDVNDGTETDVDVPFDRETGGEYHDGGNPFNDVGPYAGSKSAKLLKVFALVEDRERLGISTRANRLAEVSKFEEMDSKILDGFIQATREFKSAQRRTAGRRVAMTTPTRGDRVMAGRVPSMGQLAGQRQSTVGESDASAEDSLAFL